MSDVLVFDSGVGGLSVVQEIRALLPELQLSYLCDNAALPYGTKPDAWLIERIVKVCSAACDTLKPKLLVVACNTASTLALEALRQTLDIPVVGTVPAIKTASQLSQTRVIGLLATSATINRPYLERLIATHASDCQLVRVGADSLVTQAEQFLRTQRVDVALIDQALAPFASSPNIDTVVMGCTHFPHLREAFEDLHPEWIWIDSGRAIAKRVAWLVNEMNSESVDPAAGHVSASTALLTALNDDALVKLMQSWGFGQVNLLNC